MHIVWMVPTLEPAWALARRFGSGYNSVPSLSILLAHSKQQVPLRSIQGATPAAARWCFVVDTTTGHLDRQEHF